MPFPEGLELPPDMLAKIRAAQSQTAIQVAQPMNDTQNLSLVAASLAAGHPLLDANELLDLATELIVGAYSRALPNGAYMKALQNAKAKADEAC